MVLHFLIVDYLAELYEVVLDVVPNIASTNDRKFVESVMIVARKVLQIEPIVTVQQVLGEGFLEKKVQFVTEVAKKVVEWETSNCKKAKQPNRNYQSYQNYQSKGHYDSDESE